MHPGERRSQRLFSAVTAPAPSAAAAALCRLTETWEAFDRYTSQYIAHHEHNPLRVPTAADRSPKGIAARLRAPGPSSGGYAALDADLVRWHSSMSELYDRCASMAVVGQLQDNEFELEFSKGFSGIRGAEGGRCVGGVGGEGGGVWVGGGAVWRCVGRGG